jgi:hypothetical protein|tara:strand:+ start:1366 stop:3216 length:1851 start_codon:yes stop_codon:yes gene_type:complete
MLVKYTFNPGINREGTELTAGSGWYDADKIRFRKGRPEQIGGWQKYSNNTFLGICRSLLDWVASASVEYLGVGTNLKFYVNEGTAYNDVTPIRETTAAGAVTFSATNGSSTLAIADTNHGAIANDFVTFSGAVSLGGNITAAVLNQEYQILSIVDGSNYTVTAKNTSGVTVTASAGDAGNGGVNVVGAYQINTGLNTFVSSSGFGAGTWGSSAWGGSTAITAGNQLRLWSQDTFGNDLIFCARGGGIFYWDESAGTATRAVALVDKVGAVGPPSLALQVMVSETDRHTICFGCNGIGIATIDPLLVRWSDQENPFDWTPTSTNTSGGVTLTAGSFIVGAIKTRQEILIFTNSSIHSMRFSGSPFTYQFEVVNEGLSMISPNAATNAGDMVFFMDRGGFYFYNGSIQRLTCSVLDYVFSNINTSEEYKVFATTNVDFSEVYWFYPVGTGNTECTNYVSYNYMEDSWSIGTLTRGAWIPANTRTNPIAAGAETSSQNNYLYNHEFGHDADGVAMNGYIESGGIQMGDGEDFMSVSRMIPDFEFRGTSASASMDITLKGKDFPLNAATTLATATVTPATNQSFLRARTRESIIRVESTGTGYGWTLGELRFDVRADGRR